MFPIFYPFRARFRASKKIHFENTKLMEVTKKVMFESENLLSNPKQLNHSQSGIKVNSEDNETKLCSWVLSPETWENTQSP